MRILRILMASAVMCASGCGRPSGGLPPGDLGVRPAAAPLLEGAGGIESGSDALAPIDPVRTAADRIVNRAKEEARRGVLYDASYQTLPYPGGDVPPDRGACTDVVVRSLRAAGIDLQRQIHEDMLAHYDRYPHNWSVRHPDANIDHRRGANHITFLRRHARALTTATGRVELRDWMPGDVVYWKLGNNLDHCGIISNVRNAEGVPLVIHNIGQARQEDCLRTWRVAAHFRYPSR